MIFANNLEILNFLIPKKMIAGSTYPIRNYIYVDYPNLFFLGTFYEFLKTLQ